MIHLLLCCAVAFLDIVVIGEMLSSFAGGIMLGGGAVIEGVVLSLRVLLLLGVAIFVGK